MDVVPQSRIDLFAEMESHYEKQDTEYFVKLLEHEIMLLDVELHVS